MIIFLLPLLLLTGLLANYVPEGSSCKCVNPFSGTQQAFLGDKELTCETNQLCYVPCDSLCGWVAQNSCGWVRLILLFLGMLSMPQGSQPRRTGVCQDLLVTCQERRRKQTLIIFLRLIEVLLLCRLMKILSQNIISGISERIPL